MRYRVASLIDTLASPEAAGKRFAEGLLDQKIIWANSEFQLTGVPTRLLVSSFWASFLRTFAEQAPPLLPDVLVATWVCDQEFQEENISRWMEDFAQTQLLGTSRESR